MPVDRLLNEMQAGREKAEAATQVVPAQPAEPVVITLSVPVIEKKDPKRAVNFYLHQSTIDKITKTAKKYGLRKSEFVEKILTQALSQIKP